MVEAEEYRKIGPVRAWLILFLLAALVVGYGVLNYELVRERPRAWDFGALPQTPSESPYTSVSPPAQTPAPRQMPRLPEATTQGDSNRGGLP